MTDVPVALAFTTGLLATVNPCGFAMLPAYLGYFLGIEDDGPRGRGVSVAKGLAVGGVVSLGFFLVFAVIGTIVSAGFDAFIDVVPWIALTLGVGLVGLGVAMTFFNFQFNFTLPHLEKGGSSRDYRSMFLFGLSYGVASLSCTLPLFLGVVSLAAAASNFATSLLTFVFYGAGMAMTLITLTIAMAVGKDSILRHLRFLMQRMTKISGVILILVGGFIAAFWAANINDPLAAGQGLFGWVEQLQSRVQSELEARPGTWGTLFGVLIAAAVSYVLWIRFRGGESDEGVPEDDLLAVEAGADGDAGDNESAPGNGHEDADAGADEPAVAGTTPAGGDGSGSTGRA